MNFDADTILSIKSSNIIIFISIFQEMLKSRTLISHSWGIQELGLLALHYSVLKNNNNKSKDSKGDNVVVLEESCFYISPL